MFIVYIYWKRLSLRRFQWAKDKFCSILFRSNSHEQAYLLCCTKQRLVYKLNFLYPQIYALPNVIATTTFALCNRRSLNHVSFTYFARYRLYVVSVACSVRIVLFLFSLPLDDSTTSSNATQIYMINVHLVSAYIYLIEYMRGCVCARACPCVCFFQLIKNRIKRNSNIFKI